MCTSTSGCTTTSRAPSGNLAAELPDRDGHLPGYHDGQDTYRAGHGQATYQTATNPTYQKTTATATNPTYQNYQNNLPEKPNRATYRDAQHLGGQVTGNKASRPCCPKQEPRPGALQVVRQGVVQVGSVLWNDHKRFLG